MRIATKPRACFLAALTLLSTAALPAQPAGGTAAQQQTASADLAAAMAQYRRDLAAYEAAQSRYAAASSAYWHAISQKRHLRARKRAAREALSLEDYVLTQPLVYRGPHRPRDPSKPYQPPPLPRYVPVVADFLAAARHEFAFSPRLPKTEGEFKRAYAVSAAAAGLSKDQIVRIYGFEATGNGAYDVEAGLEYNKRGRAITTALGYNQLLATNSVEIMAEHGRVFVAELAAEAAALPPEGARAALLRKIAVLRRMIGFARSVPDDWNKHDELAHTQKGLAIHALNLDLDVGPLLQTQKLLDSVVFARRKGFTGTLTAAELEMMNLTGDGNGFDMIAMPAAWRAKVPTANFFQRSGYFDNPVAQRNNVVSKLIAATNAQMEREARKPGARQLAAAWR